MLSLGDKNVNQLLKYHAARIKTALKDMHILHHIYLEQVLLQVDDEKQIQD